MEVHEEELEALYTWVDEIPLSRPKRNIARDFSDGVLMAEIVRHFQPKLVELHNYSSANSSTQKMYNWNTLNQKVFKKLGFIVTKQEIESVCNCEMGAIERVLKLVKVKIEAYNSRKQSSPGLEGSTTTADMASTSPGAQGGVVDGPAAKQGEGAALPGGYGGQGGRSDRSPLRPAHDQGEAAAAAPPAAIIEEYEKQLKEGKEIIETLERKIQRLEELVRLKDKKIETLRGKLEQASLA